MNRKILRLAIPNIISNITIPLVGMVDIAIVGHLGVDTLIGSIAIGTAIFNFVYWNFAFLRMGTSGLTAQAYGARDFRAIMHILVRGVVVALAIAFALIVAQQLIGRFSFAIMNGSQEIQHHAKIYFYARIWAAPATLSLYAIQGWFIGMQNSRLPMYISIVINIVNVIIGVWFTLGMGMGIAGVAWGTVIAQYCGLFVSILFWLKYYRRFWVYLNLRESLRLKQMGHFFSVNSDIFLRTACLVSVYTFFTAASAGMGDTLLAANTLLLQLLTFFSFMMDGFAYAGESLVGKYVGARNPDITYRCVKLLLKWGAGVALLFTTIYGIWWEPLIRIFTSSPAILQATGEYLGWLMLIPLVAFIPFVIDGALIGATQTKILRNAMFISTALFFAFYYSTVGFWGNNALWVAFLIFMVVRGVLQYFMTHRLHIQ